jgi:hypothetical protein
MKAVQFRVIIHSVPMPTSQPPLEGAVCQLHLRNDLLAPFGPNR